MLPKKIGDDKSSILDPFVEVEIYGVEADCSKQKTRTLLNNGFHPVWNETLSYTVSCPQLALVLFRVIDYETTSSDVLVAQYCLPMRCMQTGYRMIALRDMNGEVVGPASLFVHITISQPTRQSFW
jgi:phosphatidylinositol phospholipase C delta